MMTLLAFGMPAAPEWIFIGILALVLFGPKKLPELARGIGKALGELQKAKEDFHREITDRLTANGFRKHCTGAVRRDSLHDSSVSGDC